MGELMIGLYVFVLATLTGREVITKVPPTLHTPLMSGANAISGIAIVGALVVEEGGPVCHAAIVAREFGCSAVTGAHGATTRIPHGVEVEVDPVRGTVTIL